MKRSSRYSNAFCSDNPLSFKCEIFEWVVFLLIETHRGVIRAVRFYESTFKATWIKPEVESILGKNM